MICALKLPSYTSLKSSSLPVLAKSLYPNAYRVSDVIMFHSTNMDCPLDKLSFFRSYYGTLGNEATLKMNSFEKFDFKFYSLTALNFTRYKVPEAPSPSLRDSRVKYYLKML